jgi:hypothetical protein
MSIFFRNFIFILLLSFFATVTSASAENQTSTITVTSTGFTINIQSGSENVAYQWVAPAPATLWTIGSVLVTESIAGGSSQGQIALGSHIDWVGPAGVLQSVTYQTSGTTTATLSYLSASGTTHLTLQPLVDGNFAGIRMTVDLANIQDIYLGQLSAGQVTRETSVPYYSQAINYVGALDLFENAYFDSFASNGSTLTNVETFYAPNGMGPQMPYGTPGKYPFLKTSPTCCHILSTRRRYTGPNWLEEWCLTSGVEPSQPLPRSLRNWEIMG